MLKSLERSFLDGFTRGFLFVTISVILVRAAYAEPPALQNDRATARLYELAAREAQFQSLAAIPDADVEYSNFGRLRRLEGNTGVLIPEILSAKRGDSAAAVLRKLKAMLLASGAESD